MTYRLCQASTVTPNRVRASTYEEIMRAGFKVDGKKDEESFEDAASGWPEPPLYRGVTIALDSLDSLDDLNRLNRLINLVGDIVIEKDDDGEKSICIYDGYIE